MILKKQDKDGLVKALYNSTNIVASIYESKTNTLDLIFKAGTKYRYNGVSKSDYMRFEIADSQGEIFNSHIKKYPVSKLENVDVTKILEEGTSLKQQEHNALVEAKRERLVKTLRGVVLLADGNKPIVDLLDRVKTEIDDYVNKLNEIL